jgi:TRAP-type C4-dicarboxylate transport system substrate-binding protein
MTISSLLLLAVVAAFGGETKTLKFATLAPEGSTWMKVMGDLNKELQEKTQGRVKFKMYPGGISGDEKDVVKKVRIGQLHAAGFTGVGLGEIAPPVRILDAPWLFRNLDEVDHVYKKFDKDFTAAIDKSGYVLLGWMELGRVYVFSKEPINSPADMKKAKMWVWEGDPIATAAYEALGVSPIPLSVVDVMSSLQAGLIDAVYGPPMGVVALQWFTKTKNIYAVPMADSAGAVLLSKKAFDELSKEDQKILKDVASSHLRRLTLLGREENEKALFSLQKQGLSVSAKPDAATLKQYEELGRTARRSLAGKLYPAELLDRVEKALADLRSGKAKKA